MVRSERVSEHRDILNSLVEMQESHVYASRKSILLCAEQLIYKMEQEINRIKDDLGELRSMVDSAPIAIMDTRDVLGICAPAEGDFPALYALQGKRVKLVVWNA